MASILGIDYGLKRIGIAVGHIEEKLALPLTVIANDAHVFEAIKALIEEHEPTLLLFGLPKTLKNQEEYMAEAVRKFAQDCQDKLGCEVDFSDERLSSKQVSRQLSQVGFSQKKQRGKIDAHAAAVIVEGYLDQSF
eukprot:COSAG01_NODE_1_length_100484_cov_170.446142_26_plen_136_part_00